MVPNLEQRKCNVLDTPDQDGSGDAINGNIFEVPGYSNSQNQIADSSSMKIMGIPEIQNVSYGEGGI